MLRIVSLIAVMFLQGIAHAETVPDVSRADQTLIKRAFGDKVAEKIFSNDLAALRADMLKKSGQNIPGYDCKGDRLSALIEALPYPIKPGVYSWVERYLVDCEPRTRRNLMVIVEDDHARAIELLPGETKADPRLQRDAIQIAKAAAASAGGPDCKHSWTTDTRAIETYKDGKTPWTEQWSFDVCGNKTVVEMSFVPGGASGTSYTAKLVK